MYMSTAYSGTVQGLRYKLTRMDYEHSLALEDRPDHLATHDCLHILPAVTIYAPARTSLRSLALTVGVVLAVLAWVYWVNSAWPMMN